MNDELKLKICKIVMYGLILFIVIIYVIILDLLETMRHNERMKEEKKCLNLYPYCHEYNDRNNVNVCKIDITNERCIYKHDSGSFRHASNVLFVISLIILIASIILIIIKMNRYMALIRQTMYLTTINNNYNISSDVENNFVNNNFENNFENNSNNSSPISTLSSIDMTIFDGDSYQADECIICMTNIPNVIILDCGHMCICKECYDVNKRDFRNMPCPICREPIVNFKVSKNYNQTIDDDDINEINNETINNETIDETIDETIN